MKSVIQADDWFSAKMKTVIIGPFGIFDVEHLLRPAIVLSSVEEQNPQRPVSRNAMKLITVELYGYTEYFGEEKGVIGDNYTVGVSQIANRLELLFDDNLLRDELPAAYQGWIARAHVTSKLSPDAVTTRYIGLNEKRVRVEYMTINPQYV